LRVNPFVRIDGPALNINIFFCQYWWTMVERPTGPISNKLAESNPDPNFLPVKSSSNHVLADCHFKNITCALYLCIFCINSVRIFKDLNAVNNFPIGTVNSRSHHIIATVYRTCTMALFPDISSTCPRRLDLSPKVIFIISKYFGFVYELDTR
jgi:hypothetical protein